MEALLWIESIRLRGVHPWKLRTCQLEMSFVSNVEDLREVKKTKGAKRPGFVNAVSRCFVVHPEQNRQVVKVRGLEKELPVPCS